MLLSIGFPQGARSGRGSNEGRLVTIGCGCNPIPSILRWPHWFFGKALAVGWNPMKGVWLQRVVVVTRRPLCCPPIRFPQNAVATGMFGNPRRRESSEGRLVTVVVVVARPLPMYLPRLVVQKAFALGANLTKGVWLQSLWL